LEFVGIGLNSNTSFPDAVLLAHLIFSDFLKPIN
jgi:hypothetical protein